MASKKFGKSSLKVFTISLIVLFYFVMIVLASTIIHPSLGVNSNVSYENNFSHLNISDSDLALYLPFDIVEDSNNMTYDYTNNSNDGTLNNGVTFNSSGGIYGGAYNFNGTQQYIDVADGTTLNIQNNLTVSLWMKPYYTGDYQTPLGKLRADGTHTSPYFAYVVTFEPLNSTTYYPGFGITNAGVFQSYNDISTFSNYGEWIHFAAVYTNNTDNLSLYLNGQLFLNVTDTGGSLTSYPAPLRLGANGAYNEEFNGTMDEVMIFNRSLSDEEIAQIYNSTFPRFYYVGESLFQNINFSINNSVNISIPGCQQLNGSKLSFKINDGNYTDLNSTCSYTNYSASGNLTSANLTIKFNSTPNYFYSPLILGNITLLSSFSGDFASPTYSQNQTNNTYIGQSTLFSIYVEDNVALPPLGYYIFSTNNTGVWANDSAVNFTTNPSWANVTKTLNDTLGESIGYRWYLYDNYSRNENITPIFTLTASQYISISSCQDITSSGSYLLMNNVNSTGTCFNISASDVSIDCNNYNVSYGNSSVTGYAFNMSGVSNIIVNNCGAFRNYDSDNNAHTFYAYNSSNLTVSGAMFYEDLDGSSQEVRSFYIDDVDGVSILDSNASVIYFNVVSNSNISDSFFRSNDDSINAVYLIDSPYNTFSNNTFIMEYPRRNYVYYSDNSSHNYFANNSFESPGNDEQMYSVIYMTGTLNNTFIQNNASSYGRILTIYGNTNQEYNHTFTNNLVEGLPLIYNYSISDTTVFENQNMSNYGLVACASCTNVTYSNLSFYGHGISLFNSSNVSILNSSFDAAYSNLIYADSSSDNLTLNNLILNSTTGSTEIVSSESNNLSVQNLTIYGSARGMVISGDGLVLNEITINTTSSTALGYSITSGNITIRDASLTSVSGIAFYPSSTSSLNATVYDSEFSGGLYDIRFLSAGAQIYAYNTSFSVATFSSSTGSNIFSYEYLDVNVTNSTGSMLSGANITAEDNNGTLRTSNTTDGTNLSRLFILTKLINSTSSYTYNNYDINASATGYVANSTNINVANSSIYTDSNHLLLTLTTYNLNYTNNQTNSTVAGYSTLFSLYADGTGLHPLGYFIFSTNNTGVWANDSAVNFTTTPSWANVTKTLNDTVGESIGYRWYLYDSSSNENVTDIFTLTTTADSTEPTVTISAPSNTTYTSSSISFGVTAVDDFGVASCVYSFNEGTTNFTLTNSAGNSWTATNSSVANGGYNVTFYCQDDSGNMNSTSPLYFTVSVSSSSSTSTSSGGGGGGSTTVSGVESYTVNTTNLTLDVGYYTTNPEEISITNDGTVALVLNLTQTSLNGRVVFPSSSIEVAPGETKILNLVFFALNDTGVYNGTIYIGDKSIDVTINVREIELLFDSNIVVLNKAHAVRQGDSLKTSIELIPQGDSARLDVTLNYIVEDYEGNVYLTKSESFLVQERTTFEREFDTGVLPPGQYVLKFELVYPNGVAPSNANFEVLGMLPASLFGKIVFYLINAILIVLVALIAFIIRNLIRNR